MSLVPLGQLIASAATRRAGDRQLPILSMTMHGGLVDQSSKFKKRIASEDTSTYKVVQRGQLVVGFPIDEGVLDFQSRYDEAVVSPAYGIWDVRDEGRVDRNYLSRYLRSPGALAFYRSRLRATTARRRSLPAELFLELPVRLPLLDEQRRITGILDQADSIRARRRRMVSVASGLPQAIYGDMMTSLSPEWVPLERALESASVFTDGDWVESRDQDPAGDVRLTQLADVGDGAWLDRSSRFLTSSKASELRCTYLEPGDVLVARMPDPLGRACVFPGAATPCITVVDVCVIRVDPSVHAPEWLAATLNSPRVRSQIARMATGSTRSRVSRGNLKKVIFPHVPLDVQREYVRRAQQVDASVKALQVALLAEDGLVDNLRMLAFSGGL